jgi:hypothetical protein
MNYEKNDPSRTRETNANRDPISGAPGAHPIGTGVGAAVGAIVSGLAGKGVAEVIDPTSEASYWRDNFKSRPYAENATSFDDYGPAYGYGVSSYAKYPGRSFDDVEADLSRDWDGARGASNLPWDQARNATRDAWERIRNR